METLENLARDTPFMELVPSDTTPTNHLVDLAYSMALEPHRFGAMATILENRLDQMLSSGDSIAQNLSEITEHFDRALNPMERQGRRFNYATGSIRYVEADQRPSLLIYPDGKVFHVNTAAESELGFEEGARIQAKTFEHGHYKRLLADLHNLSSHDVDKVIGVYTVYAGASSSPLKLSLSRTLDYNGHDIGRLCTFHFKWLPEMENDFKNAFSLTPVEMEITRAIVLGVSLADLSKQRGRSLATIRKQTKNLFAKIGLKSQTELACIYSGFTQFSNKSTATTQPDLRPQKSQDDWRRSALLDLPGGRQLHYEMVGPKSGRPVLFFHGLVGGTVVSRPMRDLLNHYNLRLIMPWRPYFGHTSPDRGRRKAIEDVARDTEQLLDHLKIDTCPIISVIAGSIYAYAAQVHMPDRITALINTASSIPLKSKSDFEDIDTSSRVSLYVGRYAPELLHMLMRSVIQKIDAGFDEEFVREHYSKFPADIALMSHPDFKLPIRNNFSLQTVQGYMCFVRDVQIQASRWDKKINTINCPVTLIHGEDDKAFSLNLAQKFVTGKDNYSLIAVPNAGQLVYFQAPEIVYDAVSKAFN